MLRIIVGIHRDCCMPGLQCCSVSIGCLIQNFACIKVDFVILTPSMFCYVTTGFTLFDVSFMFLFSRSESTAGFTYITATTISAINLVYNVGLFLGKWSVLW